MKTVAINRRDKTKTDRASKVHKDWYKLDLSAIVYPTLQRRDFSSVYRLSVLLKEEINAAAGGESDNASFSDV